MAAPTSTARRTIWLLYWAAWLYLSLAVGFCFAGATWMMPLYVAGWTVLGVPLMLGLGLWAVVLLTRSLTGMGTGDRLPKLVKWLAPAALLVSIGLSAWAVLPGFIDGVRRIRWPGGMLVTPSASYPSQWSFDPESFLSMISSWDWQFVLLQSGMCALLLSLAIFTGRLIWRHVSTPEPNRTSRRRLLASVIVICGALPALTFGGYELARGAGMMTVFLAYRSHMENVFKVSRSTRASFWGAVQQPSPVTIAGPIERMYTGDRYGWAHLKGNRVLNSSEMSPPFIRRRQLIWEFPKQLQCDPWTSCLEPLIQRPEQVYYRPLWGGWFEMGPGLIFRLPPGTAWDEMAMPVGSRTRDFRLP